MLESSLDTTRAAQTSRRGAFAYVAAIGLALASACSLASPISDKYAALGGAAGFLGSTLTAEITAADGVGRYQDYQFGSIYWHPQSGAHEVHGLIRNRWTTLGREQSYLGYPLTDEINRFDGSGKVSKFRGGELIYRSATNQVFEVKTKDLIVDLPFPVGQAWHVIQANAAADTDSHRNAFVYCYDMILAGQPQSASNGRPFTSVATAPLVLVEQDNPPAGNVIVQRLGEGRYASYLHMKTGSYSFDPDALFSPQALPWELRPTPFMGAVLGQVGDSGATPGAYHMHFCVTTQPDRPAYKPFESVPVAFRNYSVSNDGGLTWQAVSVGVPRKGQWVRRNSAPAQPATVNDAAKVLSYGTVQGQVLLTPGDGKPTGSGVLNLTVTSNWGEPLRGTFVSVLAGAPNGPWSYQILNVPAGSNLTVAVGYAGPWSIPLGGGGVSAQSAPFNLAPGATATKNLSLKSLVLN